MPEEMSVGYNKQTLLSSVTPAQIEARFDFEEVKTLKERLLGVNDTSNDFSLKLPIQPSGSVVIRPQDAPELLRAARSSYAELGITVYDHNGKQVGTMDPQLLEKILKPFDS